MRIYCVFISGTVSVINESQHLPRFIALIIRMTDTVPEMNTQYISKWLVKYKFKRFSAMFLSPIILWRHHLVTSRQSVSGGVCGPGFYCAAGSRTPVACPKSFYCSGDGNFELVNKCDAGYYCPAQSTTPTGELYVLLVDGTGKYFVNKYPIIIFQTLLFENSCVFPF